MNTYLEALLRCTLSMSAITLLLLAATPLLMRRYSALSGYCAWLLVLVGFVVPLRPRFTYWVSGSLPIARQIVPAPIPVPGGWANPEGLLPVPEVWADPAAPGWQGLALVIWLVGALAVAARHIHGHMHFAGLVRRWSTPVADPAALELLRIELGLLGISREIGLRLCRAIPSPTLAGFVRPVILLPDLPADRDELALILRHELVHYRRGDLPARVLMMLAAVIHWFNPLAHMAARTAAALCERSCDARVLRGMDGANRRRYCEAIIRRAGSRRLPPAFTTAYAGGKRGLRRRLAAILDSEPKHRGGWILLAAGAAALLAGATWSAEVRAGYDASVYVNAEAAEAAEVVSSQADNDEHIGKGEAYATRQDFLSSFQAAAVDITGGVGPRHSVHNGQLALYSHNGGDFQLNGGDLVSIKLTIDTILAGGHTAGIGYVLNGIYTEVFSGKLGYSATVTFPVEKTGAYRLFLACVSSDPIRVERIEVTVAADTDDVPPLPYTVQEGDTPESISEAFLIQPELLRQWNPDIRHTLLPGQVLYIPQRAMAFFSPVFKATGTPYLEEGAGLIIPCAEKTPVYATRGGTVVQAQEHYTGYGHQVLIDHGDGYRTRYGYCSSIAVETGDTVAPGEQIALSGSTGRAPEASLLFEIHYNDQVYNPLDYIPVN